MEKFEFEDFFASTLDVIGREDGVVSYGKIKDRCTFYQNTTNNKIGDDFKIQINHQNNDELLAKLFSIEISADIRRFLEMNLDYDFDMKIDLYFKKKGIAGKDNNCNFFKKNKKIENESYNKNVKEYNCVFFKHFFSGFIIVAVLAFFIGHFNWFSHLFNIKISEKIFEIIATIIGFLGVLLGFLLTALGVITSGVKNRYQNEKYEVKKPQLDLYLKYIITISKDIVFLLVGYILFFIISLTQIETLNQYNLHPHFLAWSVLSTILICILIFDRIFDFYDNPFE